MKRPHENTKQDLLHLFMKQETCSTQHFDVQYLCLSPRWVNNSLLIGKYVDAAYSMLRNSERKHRLFRFRSQWLQIPHGETIFCLVTFGTVDFNLRFKRFLSRRIKNGNKRPMAVNQNCIFSSSIIVVILFNLINDCFVLKSKGNYTTRKIVNSVCDAMIILAYNRISPVPVIICNLILFRVFR